VQVSVAKAEAGSGRRDLAAGVIADASAVVIIGARVTGAGRRFQKAAVGDVSTAVR